MTFNTRDFPEAALRTYGIEAQHPDVFIRHVLDLHEAAALMTVRRLRMALRRPAMRVNEYLDTLARQGPPEVVAFLRQRADLI